MNTYIKQAAFVLAVFAIAKAVNNSMTIPVIGNYLPK